VGTPRKELLTSNNKDVTQSDYVKGDRQKQSTYNISLDKSLENANSVTL
jgi:hypothetical protein